MNVNEVYTLIQYIVNKNQQGYVSPSDFNQVINQAQKSYTSYLLGSFQGYMPGRPVARVEFGQNSVIRDRLSPIIRSNYTLNIDSTGFSPYPTDYLQTDAIITTSFQRVRYVQQDSLYSYYNSVIDPISSNPIYLMETAGFRFYPVGLGTAILSYVKNPPIIIWGYTTDPVTGRPVYDPTPGVSIDPVWDDAAIFEIISRALSLIGVNLQSAAISQFAESIKREGQ